MSDGEIDSIDKDAEIEKLKHQVVLLASRFTSLAEAASIVSDAIGYTVAASNTNDLKPPVFEQLNRLNRTIEWTTADVQEVILGSGHE